MKAVDAEINRGEPGDRGGARAESQCWSKPSRCRATRVWDGYGALGEVALPAAARQGSKCQEPDSKRMGSPAPRLAPGGITGECKEAATPG